MSAYQTSKLAVLRFSEFMNLEYLDKGVLTLVVHPGGIMTELARNLPAETHGREFFPFHSLLSRPVRPSSAQPHPPSQNISPCLEPCQGKPETH